MHSVHVLVICLSCYYYYSCYYFLPIFHNDIVLGQFCHRSVDNRFFIGRMPLNVYISHLTL